MKPVFEKILRKKISLKAPPIIKGNIDRELNHLHIKPIFYWKTSFAILSTLIILFAFWNNQINNKPFLKEMDTLISYFGDYELYENQELFVSYNPDELDEHDWEILIGEHI